MSSVGEGAARVVRGVLYAFVNGQLSKIADIDNKAAQGPVAAAGLGASAGAATTCTSSVTIADKIPGGPEMEEKACAAPTAAAATPPSNSVPPAPANHVRVTVAGRTFWANVDPSSTDLLLFTNPETVNDSEEQVQAMRSAIENEVKHRTEQHEMLLQEKARLEKEMTADNPNLETVSKDMMQVMIRLNENASKLHKLKDDTNVHAFNVTTSTTCVRARLSAGVIALTPRVCPGAPLLWALEVECTDDRKQIVKEVKMTQKSILDTFGGGGLKPSRILTDTALINRLSLIFSEDNQTPATGVRLELLYQTPSRDEWTPKAFHAKCDNKGPTLMVCKSTAGCIFGGYAGGSWSAANSYVECNAWLFSLHNPMSLDDYCKFLPSKEPQYALYSVQSEMAIFGKGNDLWVRTSPRAVSSRWSTYAPAPGFTSVPLMGCEVHGANDKHVAIAELEVYAVTFTNKSAHD